MASDMMVQAVATNCAWDTAVGIYCNVLMACLKSFLYTHVNHMP